MSIPANAWVERRIGDDCFVGDGIHAKIKRQESGIPYLTCKNFKDGKLDLSKIDYISVSDFSKHCKDNSHAKIKPKYNDVVFSIIGSIGEPYLVKDNDHFGISSSVAILRSSSSLSPKYLFYWIKGSIFQDALHGIKGGVAQGYVSLEMIRSLPLKYPSLAVQCKIASILSAYDDLIENNTRRIKILEEMAQSLYREWFVNFRFPGHEKVQMVDSPLGKIPVGWEIKKLGTIADINSASLRNGNAPDEICYIDISSVSTGRIDKIERIPFSEAPSRARRIVGHGDVIWSAVRPNRKSYSLILNPPKDLIVSTGFAVISPKYVPYTYLYQALTTDNFVSYLTNHATGAAYPAVNAHDFVDANILLPTKELLEPFNSITRDLMDLKQNLLQKNENNRRTRDLLLPKLISGELNVDPIDIKTEAMTS